MNINLNIRSAYLQVKTPIDLVIIWKRGAKTIDTKVAQVSAEQPQAMFNEKFEMKTQLDYDPISMKFLRKKSDLQLWTADLAHLLGTADFDLGKYGNMSENVQHTDRLPIPDC